MGLPQRYTVILPFTRNIFHSRKLPFRDYLMAIALFVNGVKGKSALELGRDLDVSYKTA